MLTGSRIITCHVTMEHTPPLPSGFNINGYLIRSLKQTDSLCHVYYASDANHVQYLLREFCPQGLAVRDPESGKLRYPENTDIEREVLPLKNDFEAQFRTGSLGKSPLWAPCTWLMPFPAAMPPRSRLPARPPLRHPSSSAISGPWPLPEPPGAPVHAGSLPQLRKKKNSAGIWILTLLLLGGACGTYYFTRNPAEKPVSAQEPDVPPLQQGKESRPARREGRSLPEQENAAGLSPSGLAEQPEKTPPATSSGERNEDAPGALEEKSAATHAQPDENSSAPADDAADGKQPEPQQPANREESQEGQTAAKPAPVVRPRGKAARQTTNMGDVNAYVKKKFAKPMPLNQWRKQYAELYTSWFGNSEEVAKGWITTFGPLGFRARGLDASWPDTNFRGFFPKTMLDPNGGTRGEPLHGHPGD